MCQLFGFNGGEFVWMPIAEAINEISQPFFLNGSCPSSHQPSFVKPISPLLIYSASSLHPLCLSHSFYFFFPSLYKLFLFFLYLSFILHIWSGSKFFKSIGKVLNLSQKYIFIFYNVKILMGNESNIFFFQSFLSFFLSILMK